MDSRLYPRRGTARHKVRSYMSESLSQDQLLELAVAGDTDALDKLLAFYYSDLHDYVARRVSCKLNPYIDPDDIVQQTLLEVFAGIEEFRVGERSFSAWVLRIANNRIIDTVRWHSREKRGGGRRVDLSPKATKSSVDFLLGWVHGDVTAPEAGPRRDEVRCALQICLARLKEDQRRALYAHFYLQRSVNEIAKEMDRTPGAVRELMRRGQDNLRRAMGRASEWLSSH